MVRCTLSGGEVRAQWVPRAHAASLRSRDGAWSLLVRLATLLGVFAAVSAATTSSTVASEHTRTAGLLSGSSTNVVWRGNSFLKPPALIGPITPFSLFVDFTPERSGKGWASIVARNDSLGMNVSAVKAKIFAVGGDRCGFSALPIAANVEHEHLLADCDL
jgi:hypothetical protein